MFAKTVCRPGTTITIVPVGLNLTLQYNRDGVLEKVFKNFGEIKSEITSSIYQIMIDSSLCPASIPIKGGTTWVEGVLYTHKHFNDEGTLPYCISDTIVHDLAINSHDYMFYSGTVDSLGAAFNGASNMRTWLQLAGFHLLPAVIVPANLTNNFIETQMKADKLFQFEYPLISGVINITEANHTFLTNGLTQLVVDKIEKFTNPEGFIQARIQSLHTKLVVHYSDVVTYNIQKGTTLVLDNNTIIYSRPGDKPREAVKDVIVCSTCGNLFRAATSGPVCCTDDHCLSKMYPQVTHFLQTLKLPILSITAYQEHVKKHNIQMLSDVLTLDKYKDIEINTNLVELIEACTPVEVCVDRSVFSLFVNTCFNQVETVKYYLNNPTKLSAIPSTSIFADRFKTWLSDTQNSAMIQACIDSPNIQFNSKESVAFEGAPIFRNKTILLTGTFTHGDSNVVASILRGYAANIVYDYSEDVNCVIVGDIKTNINGRAISSAGLDDVPVFEEAQFFRDYGIDDDLKKANLL